MEIVPFELAKKLKEKGFPQHITDYAYIVENYGEDEYDIGDRMPIPLIPDYMDDVAAPTISQVLNWLRKTHNLFIVVFLSDDSDNPVTFEIYKGTECVTDYHIKYYPLDEWSNAEIDAIKYVIDNLI